MNMNKLETCKIRAELDPSANKQKFRRITKSEDKYIENYLATFSTKS